MATTQTTDRYIIVANYREGTKYASKGAKAYVLFIPGSGESVEIVVKSRCGRMIHKWTRTGHLCNFRIKTVVAKGCHSRVWLWARESREDLQNTLRFCQASRPIDTRSAPCSTIPKQQDAPKASCFHFRTEGSNMPELVNKSEQTRKWVQKHPKSTQNEVVAAMKSQGIEISTALAGNILRELRGITRPRKKTARKGVTVKQARAKSVNGEPVAIEHLREAKRLADQMGGIDRLQAAVEALREVQVGG